MERLNLRRMISVAALIVVLALSSLAGCESGCSDMSPTSPDRQTDS